MGKHRIWSNITDNGERFIDICQENNLVIGGTLFTHKDIHKLTWTSPDRKTQSQIDHIIINGKWRHSLQDVRVMRHANIGSDHNLLVSKVKLKLRKAKIGSTINKQVAIENLNDPATIQDFCLSHSETALTHSKTKQL